MNRIQEIEDEVGKFNTYYEPFGPPGYGKLKSDEERKAYDIVFDKYRFAGAMLLPFSPYIRKFLDEPFPNLPFDVAAMEQSGWIVPEDVKTATGYREFLALLEGYAKMGLRDLRAVNPITRGKPVDQVDDDD